VAALRAFARHEFSLSRSSKGGGTIRQHLESFARQAGKVPQSLIGPPRPAGAEMVWRIFTELNSARRWTDFGQPLAVPHSEILAAYAVNRYRLSLNDVAIIRMLDHEYRTAMASNQPRDEDDDWTSE
jgi:hypothetical protein